MRRLLIAGSLVAALAAPSLAAAQQTKCERDRQTNRVAGTVVGAGIGALLGSAVAGRHSGTTGAIVGGVAGGVAGNQLSKRAGEPCPTGYYEVPTTAPAPAAPPPQAFWRGAPGGVRERIDYMENRIRRGERNGALSRDEADQAYRDLGDLRRTEFRLRRRDGGSLSPTDVDYLQGRLDDVGRRVRWTERSNGYAAGGAPGYNAPPRSYDSNRGGYDSSRGAYDSNRGAYDSGRGGYDQQTYPRDR